MIKNIKLSSRLAKIYTNTTVKSDRYNRFREIINANNVGTTLMLLAFTNLIEHIQQQIKLWFVSLILVGWLATDTTDVTDDLFVRNKILVI